MIFCNLAVVKINLRPSERQEHRIPNLRKALAVSCHLLGLFKNILNLFSSSEKSQTLSQPGEESKKKFDLEYNDLGKFKYEDDDFIFQFDKEPQKIKWADVERLVAYKADLMTIDEIRMDIVYNNWRTTITEDTPGWFQFILKTKSVFKSIPNDWDVKIIQPAFATNLTVLYEREDRIMPTKNNFYASFENINKSKIKVTLENNGWTCRKASFTDFELVNSWTELLLEGDDNSPLLNGMVSFHKKNIASLNIIFSSLGGQYTYEFYDDENLIFEKKNDS